MFGVVAMVVETEMTMAQVYDKVIHLFISAASLLSINTASVGANGVDLSPIPSVGMSVGLSACVCVWKVYCGKTADWIRMSFAYYWIEPRPLSICKKLVKLEAL